MQLMDFLIFVYERMAKNSKKFNVTIDITSKECHINLTRCNRSGYNCNR